MYINSTQREQLARGLFDKMIKLRKAGEKKHQVIRDSISRCNWGGISKWMLVGSNRLWNLSALNGI